MALTSTLLSFFKSVFILFIVCDSGLLVRVYSKAASWTIQYRYDGLGRRVASRNSLGQHLQFFYADLNYPTRITHVYNHSSSEITSFYYDLQVATLKKSVWISLPNSNDLQLETVMTLKVEESSSLCTALSLTVIYFTFGFQA